MNTLQMKIPRIYILILLLFLFVPSVSFAQTKQTIESANKTWNTFWTKFSKAVKNKNRVAIKTMASKNFEGGTEDVATWLKRLDKEKLWYLVQNSVNKGVTSFISIENKRPARYTLDSQGYELYFEYEKNGWRFTGPAQPE
jgi:hypothetical protein